MYMKLYSQYGAVVGVKYAGIMVILHGNERRMVDAY